MPSKLLKQFSLNSVRVIASLMTLAFSPLVYAATATPTEVNPVVTNLAGERSVFFLGSSYANSGDSLIAPTYGTFDFQTKSFVFDISGADPALTHFWVMAEGTTTSTFFPVTMTGCTAGSTSNRGPCVSSGYKDFRISLNLNSICQNDGGAQIRGCNATAVIGHVVPADAGALIPGLRLRFLSGGASPPVPTGTNGLLMIYPQIKPPTLTSGTCVANPGFFPGDGVVLVDTAAPQPVAATPTGGSTAFPSFWTFARDDEGGITQGNALASTIVFGSPYASGTAEISGFKNSNAKDQFFYSMRFGVQDSAGSVVLCPTTHTRVFSTDIQGFLQESNCFVATASYRDGRAAGVMLLREFRDEILQSSALGRSFIHWYYEYGPEAAAWLTENSLFRSFFLTLLMPVQVVAWVALNPLVLIFPFGALFGLLFFFMREKKSVVKAFLFLFVSVSALPASASDQPYIDSLISELPKSDDYVTPGDSPYIDSIRKSAPADDSKGYSDALKNELPPSDGSKGYAERLQRAAPKERGSAIEDYRQGKTLKANKGNLETRSAFGFNILAGVNRTYSAGANQDVPYSDVYGSGWIPDFTAHYEYRPFKSSFMKKFGLFGSLGSSFTQAKGKLAYQGDFGPDSRTRFKFISVPLNVGLIYRFNAFNFMYPYFGAGPSVIGFLENRSDEKPGNRGYTFGYWFTGGVAFGLDWMSSKSSWDRYESNGIKHSYFNIGYHYLESMGGGLVEFTVDGVEVGFTFEL